MVFAMKQRKIMTLKWSYDLFCLLLSVILVYKINIKVRSTNQYVFFYVETWVYCLLIIVPFHLVRISKRSMYMYVVPLLKLY